MRYREMTFAFVMVAVMGAVLAVTGTDEATAGRTNGTVARGYLGLVPQDIDTSLAKALDLDGVEGALVGGVTQDGPAGEAGIRRGDVITSFDGQPVEGSVDLRHQVAAMRPGSKVRVGLHRDGKEITVDVELGERPEIAT